MTEVVDPTYEVRLARDVVVGDIIYASYCIPPDDDMVCAWVEVGEIKHHTERTVTMLSKVAESDSDVVRWVEYPRSAPLVSLERPEHLKVKPDYYLVVQSRVTGNAKNGFDIGRSALDSELETLHGAATLGMNVVGSDDFNIAVIKHDGLIRWTWMGEDVETDPHELEKIADSLGLPLSPSAW